MWRRRRRSSKHGKRGTRSQCRNSSNVVRCYLFVHVLEIVVARASVAGGGGDIQTNKDEQCILIHYHTHAPTHPSIQLPDTELYSRKAIRSARLISNPGCYATNTQALVAPLLPYLDVHNPPTVFGVSGYSGAGTKTGQTQDGSPVTVPKISAEDLAGGIRPYALTDHIHEREASRHLSRLRQSHFPEDDEGGLKVAFTPTVAPWFQGIISIMSAPLNKKLTAKDVKKIYEEFYAGNDLVQLQPQVPEIKDIQLKHGIKIGGWQVHSDGKRVVVVGTIDNLLKGAATQCLQNLNIALGYDELAGIPTD